MPMPVSATSTWRFVAEVVAVTVTLPVGSEFYGVGHQIQKNLDSALPITVSLEWLAREQTGQVTSSYGRPAAA